MAGFLVTLLYALVTQIAYDAIRGIPKPDAPKPAGKDSFNFPTIEQGRPIPKPWGTVKLEAPMVTWWGDLKAEKIKDTIYYGLFNLFSTTVVKGYRYSVGIEMVFCSGPVDDVEAIYMDGRELPIESKIVSTDWTDFVVNQPKFWGGDDKEGGVVANFRVYHGTQTQVADSYMEDKLGATRPAYRGVCRMIVFGSGWYGFSELSTTPYIKKIGLRVKAVPNQLALTGGDHDVNGDANPMAMLYDLITTSPSLNGLGISAGVIDADAFRTAGATLAGEGMVLSMVQDQVTRARELIRDILLHIDALLFVEPTTGLLTPRLIRQDYDPNTLEVLDVSNCKVTAFSRPSWTEVRNAVRVAYTSREDDFQRKTVSDQELVGIAVNGGELIEQDFDLLGFSNKASASLAGGRIMKALTYPLALARIVVNRTAWDLRPGDVRKLVWSPLGITGMAVRVTKVNTGELVDGKIEIEVAEDIYGVDWNAYEPPPSSSWADPAGSVPALAAIEAFTAPYPAVAGLTPGPDQQARAITMAARGDGITSGYKAYAKFGSTWSPATEVLGLTPSGTLNTALTEASDTIVVDAGPDTDLLETVGDAEFAAGANLAWIGDELIAFQTVVQGSGIVTLTDVVRGCVDTVPKAHSAGARIWFPSLGFGLIGIQTPTSGPLNTDVRFQAFNNRGEIAFGSAPDDTATATDPDRALLPYPSADVQFNGASYPASISGELTVSWEHRDRLSTWSYADGGITAAQENGVTYDITVWGELGTIVHTETGLTGKTWTYDQATEIAESTLGRLNNHLKVRIETKRGSDAARYYVEWEFDRV